MQGFLYLKDELKGVQAGGKAGRAINSDRVTCLF